MARKEPVQPNNSLINGIACLQLIASSSELVGVRGLARELELSPTRVRRLLATLAHLGLVEQTEKKKYKAGPGIHVLAAQSLHASPLLSLALPHLMALRKDGFTAALGVLWQRNICYLFHERPGQRLDEAIARHQVHPAERSALGMTLLAATHAEAPTEAAMNIDYMDSSMKWSPLLAGIRRRGYATLRFPNGEISVGVPIGPAPFGAIGASCKMEPEAAPALAERLVQIANLIAKGA